MRAWLASLSLILALPFCSGVLAGDRELGEYLSAECTSCHQLSGSVSGGIPEIVGWPDDQFIAVLTAYKTRQRDNPVMQTIAGRLTENDIAALASFFGSLSRAK